MVETKNKYGKLKWKILLIVICLISTIILSSCSQISFKIITGDSSEVVSHGIDDQSISDSIVAPLPEHYDKEIAVTENHVNQRTDEKDETDSITSPQFNENSGLSEVIPVPEQEGGTIKPTDGPPQKTIDQSEPVPELGSKEIGNQKKAPETSQKPTQKPVLTPTPTPTPKPTIKPTATPELQPVTTPFLKDKKNNPVEYVNLILQSIITKEMTNVDKVRAVHDYIILNTAYDIENLEADTLPASSFAVEGVLYYGKAVCQGYAETFQLFMETLGIESKFVEGRDLQNNIGHAWNMVKLDGAWYHVDTTWDDPIPDQIGRAQYKYFLVTDQVLSADHSWNKDKYPACKGEKYRYFIYEDNIITSITEYEEKFVEMYNRGERTITILYPEEKLPDMSFMKNYDYLFKTVNKKRVIEYSWYPAWRLGDYTVLTVIME